MKAAEMTAQAITVACPDCGALATEPSSGSHMFEISDLERLPGSIHCDCGTRYKVRKDAKMVRVG